MRFIPRPGLALVVLLCSTAGADAWSFGRVRTPPLAGSLVDYTHQHGRDRRIWSPALGERRDLYVYLPPGYDPARRYPVLIWLHGIAEDERSFLESGLACFDAAIASGCLPPMIVAMPDGSWRQRPCLLGPRPFFANSRLGCFEDYIAVDVWRFLQCHYPIHPDRAAHIIGGTSGGGGAAYRIALKYPELFGAMIGIAPPLNLRWVDCHGRYMSNFDPGCWGWREEYRPNEVVGRFFGVAAIRMRKLARPLFGHDGAQVIEGLSRDNPIELLERMDVQPGMYQMFVAYGGRDQFNMDAQVEGFIYAARQRGIHVEAAYDPRGRHQEASVEHYFADLRCWLAQVLDPYR
jgi:pimeloyl-ACP methyl ester carboxylesterase